MQPFLAKSTIACVLLLCTASHAAAQHAPPPRFAAAVGPTAATPVDTPSLHHDLPHSTFAERLLGAGVVGVVGLIGAGYAINSVGGDLEMPDPIAGALLSGVYASAVTGGVVLATGSREGTNVRLTALMAGLGCMPLFLSTFDPGIESSNVAAGLMVTLVSAPVFAAAFHRPARR